MKVYTTIQYVLRSLWEVGNMSTKYHLKRVTGNRTLTFEQLTTVLSKIKALLNNSRLLCPL